MTLPQVVLFLESEPDDDLKNPKGKPMTPAEVKEMVEGRRARKRAERELSGGI